MSYTPEWPQNKKLEEKLKSNTEIIRKAEKLKASGVEFPVLRDKNKPGLVKVFMYNYHDDHASYCMATSYNGKMVRLIDFSSSVDGVINVAGYLKGYQNVADEEYSITEDRWETIQLLSDEEKVGLEELLKKTYATVNFWK